MEMKRCRLYAVRLVPKPFLCLIGFLSIFATDPKNAQASPLSENVAGEIFGEAVLSENVTLVRDRAAALSDNQAFDLLASWVLPDSASWSFRLSGEFTQTDPAPISDDMAEAGDFESQLVSPVFDLLRIASRAGRLKELRDRIDAVPQPTNELQNRSRAALLTLLGLEMHDSQVAEQQFDVLFDLVKKSQPTSMHDQWPETLVAYRCVKSFPDFEAVGDLLDSLVTQRVFKSIPSGAGAWFVHIPSLAGEFRYRQALKISLNSSTGLLADKPLPGWIPIARERGRTRGRGFPRTFWQWNGRECWHVGGHDEDVLLFESPLRGDFEVEADVLSGHAVLMLTAATMFGPRNKNQWLSGRFRTGTIAEKPVMPFSKTGQWIRVRSAIKDGVAKSWIHGRLVNEREVSAECDPWVGIRCWSRAAGMFRDLRVSGEPQIPETVEISGTGCRNGWFPYHEDYVDVAGSSAHWLLPGEAADGSQIVGLKRSGMDGSSAESLLRYFRPLIEDGSIDYEFFYRPGEMHVHPTLDRLAFLFEPDGVRFHWVTDGEYDRTEVSPDNSVSLDDGQPTTEQLPLKPDDWNAVRLSLLGQTVSLTLNGELILQRELESSNSRHFGLFHYAEKTAVRVRKVMMRGDWPRELPSISEQQFAYSQADSLDKELKELEPAFVHDFGKGGLSEKYFGTGGSSLARFQSGPKGVTHIQRGVGKYTQSQISAAFQMHGDLDATADFADLVLAEVKLASCDLVLTFDGGYQVSLRRRWQAADDQRLVLAWVYPAKPGTEAAKAGAVSRSYENFPTEILGGRFRIARRGDTIYVLVAEYDSEQFRVLTSRTIDTIGERSAEVMLRLVSNESATTSVTWTGLRLAAEELFTVPDPRNPPKALLYVMNADGTNLRQVTQLIPSAEGMSHASPDWSPTGDLIAFDAWSGRAETSHTFTIKPDGTGLKDLGVAAMPTFSADGKRLAFTWVFNGQATMNLDGEDRKVIAEDGWGAQWSPDGKWIAYESRGRVDGQYSSNVTIVDVKTKMKRELLQGVQASRYSQIYWNMEWSPDSRQIVFKGRLRDGSFETCITSTDGSAKSFKVLTKLSVGTDFGWHPDGKSILMSLNSAEHSGNRIFVYDLTTDELSMLEAQPMEQHNSHAVWSPDGEQILFSSRRPPEPMLWRP